MSLCLAGAGLLVQLGVNQLTLGWTHSVQKTRWEEDWRETPAGLVMTQARVQGSGAGMDPPPESRLIDGAWRWTPSVPPLRELVLRRSGATADWDVCRNGSCAPMAELVTGDPVTLKPC
jgi:hypothetical protein